MQVSFVFKKERYAFVEDHCPENVPVIPFVSILDLFYGKLKEYIGPCILKDIRLIKGIILSDFTDHPVIIDINQEQELIQLLDIRHNVHYKAHYSLFHDGIEKPLWSDLSVVQEFPGNYQFLFHGPKLHSIVKIKKDKTGSQTIGILKTALGMNNNQTDWFFDPFACDGALQMGCQLAFMVKHKASLPSKIKRAVLYQKFKEETCYAHLIFHKISGLQYVFDAHLFDSQNNPICSMEGVESYFRLSKVSP